MKKWTYTKEDYGCSFVIRRFGAATGMKLTDENEAIKYCNERNDEQS